MSLIYHPNPLLKQKSSEIDVLNENLEKLKSLLVYNMYLYDGCGLSAVQLGILKNAFVIHDFELDKERVFFNPKVITKSNKYRMFGEGCLSFPNEWYRIQRSTEITIRYFNLTEEVVEEFKGLNARIIQHECDHLQGITFDTKVKKLK